MSFTGFKREQVISWSCSEVVCGVTWANNVWRPLEDLSPIRRNCPQHDCYNLGINLVLFNLFSVKYSLKGWLGLICWSRIHWICLDFLVLIMNCRNIVLEKYMTILWQWLLIYFLAKMAKNPLMNTCPKKFQFFSMLLFRFSKMTSLTCIRILSMTSISFKHDLD